METFQSTGNWEQMATTLRIGPQTVSSSAAEDSEVGENHSAIPVDAFAKKFSINAVERRVRW